MEDKQLNASSQAWKEFIQSWVWKDFLGELSVWEDKILADLANPTFNPQQGQMHMSAADRTLYDEYLRGCLYAVRNIQQLPSQIIEAAEQDNK